MTAVYALDPFYLGLTIVITVAYQMLGFFVAWTFQFDKITDFTGGSNFVILALMTLLMGNVHEAYARNIVASVLVIVWAARLAGFLLFRVLKRGSDSRFDEIRSHFFKFFGFWIGQIFWVWVVSLPIVIVNSPSIVNSRADGSYPAFGTSRDIAGIILWAVGCTVESIADIQKYRFKSLRPPIDKPCREGLWAWSRHPSYFGEIMCWWGIWILCLSSKRGTNDSGKSALDGSIVSPIFTMLLLLFASGIPTAEKPQAKKFYLLSNGPNAKPEYSGAWINYKDYLRSTSVLVPLPPALYGPLPVILKRTVLLDLPIYQFDKSKDGLRAIEEERCRLA